MSEGEATDPRCAECQDVSAAYCNRCAPAVFDAVQSRIKVKPEGATDPLREALERISADILVSERTHRIAREALAAAPEPEWEYRAVGPDGHELVMGGEDKARDIAWLMRGRVERRRKAGEWEALPDAD